ncbi:MAG: PIN domain-containing protein [Gemmatimonadaceae bacterium]
MRFWDTSAVVPLVITQAASGKADRWYAEDPDIAMWTLTTVEITSALWRLRREESLTEDAARAAELRTEEVASASFIVADVDSVKSIAARLLRVHALRAADALQLAAALVWAGARPDGKTLHTLDDRLALAAGREGFTVS